MPKLLKISQLAAEAGVEKSTVQHYIRTGLLPEPAEKPHRNMAYYSSDLVERIRLIKEMQTRYYLPLAKIRVILEDHEGLTEIRAYLDGQSLLSASAGQDMERADLLKETGLTESDLHRLEREGFVQGQTQVEGTFYRRADVEIVHAVALMQRAGLSPKNGLHLADMTFYLDATRELIGKEVGVFTRVMGQLPRREVIALARAGLEGTNRLLIALRRKVFLDLLGELGAGE